MKNTGLPIIHATEKVALRWLRRVKGYQLRDLSYQARNSPDFLALDGKGYEIKLLHHKTIYFADTQIEKLSQQSNVTVLVFSNKYDYPVVTFPFNMVTIPGYWETYRLVKVHYSRSSIDRSWFTGPKNDKATG